MLHFDISSEFNDIFPKWSWLMMEKLHKKPQNIFTKLNLGFMEAFQIINEQNQNHLIQLAKLFHATESNKES